MILQIDTRSLTMITFIYLRLIAIKTYSSSSAEQAMNVRLVYIS